jgi:hypothetical protein
MWDEKDSLGWYVMARISTSSRLFIDMGTEKGRKNRACLGGIWRPALTFAAMSRLRNSRGLALVES